MELNLGSLLNQDRLRAKVDGENLIFFYDEGEGEDTSQGDFSQYTESMIKEYQQAVKLGFKGSIKAYFSTRDYT